MKNFRTLDQAKKDLKVIQDYVELIENYQPDENDFREQVIYTYALEGSLKWTAQKLNDKGFDIDGHPIESIDITRVITSDPPKDDALHKKIKSLYLKKTRPHRRTYTPFSLN